MERWRNKIAVVTGASSGIGAALVKDLAKAGVVAIGLARREERVRDLQKSLPEEFKKNVHAFKCDVSKEDEVLRVFQSIEEKFGGVDILVNNAGISRSTQLVAPDNSVAIREVIDTNVMGVVYCTREAFNSMKRRKVDGHVVIINSVAGHSVPNLPSLNIYPASKFAITAMTETYRQEFQKNGTKVKITSISPGAVDTEILSAEFKSIAPTLRAEDVSDAIMYVLGTPPHVQIHELTIKPIGEMF